MPLLLPKQLRLTCALPSPPPPGLPAGGGPYVNETGTRIYLPAPASAIRALLARGFLLAGLLLVLSAATAFASHYKGGQITYEDKGSGAYLVTYKSYWRSNAVGAISPSYSGAHTKNTSLATIGYTVLPDGATTEVVQQQTVTWSEPGLYTISWTSCCRVRGGSNFPEGSVGLFAAIRYEPGQTSSSPQFYDTPLFNFGFGAPVSFSFNTIDPEGHEQEYALSVPYDTKENLYNSMLASGFRVSDRGVISWQNPGKGIWLVNVKLSEKIDGVLTGAYVFRDFMLFVNESQNTAPVLEPVAARSVREENQLLFMVRATDAEGHAVKLQAAGRPLELGASFEQTSFGSTVSGLFAWTPPAGSKGPYTMQFTATDNASGFPLSSQINVQIDVTGCTPRLLTLGSLGEVCVNATAFALENPFEGGIISGPGVQGNLFSPALAGPGTHQITSTSTEGDCLHVSTQSVTVLPAPTAEVSASHPTIYIGSGRPAAVLLEAKVSGSEGATYRWSNGAAGLSQKVWPTQTTTYTVTATDGRGCSTVAQVTVQVQPVTAQVARQQEARFAVYPNPTQGRQATLEFVLEAKAAYSVELYNLQGMRVALLETGVGEAGELYKVPLDASRLPTGLYLTRLAYGDQIKVLKMVNGF
jgi:hypothetical protein